MLSVSQNGSEKQSVILNDLKQAMPNMNLWWPKKRL